MMRRLLNRCPQWAKRRLKALGVPLAGLMEQATAGKVRENLRSSIASKLQWLDIWPMGIRGERSEKMVQPEAHY